MLKNNYFSIALNDRKYLLMDLHDEEDAYNRQAVDCEQVVEKYMKGVLELIENVDFRTKGDLLRSHNLKLLGCAINEKLGTKLSLESLAFLKDFYFEARYPGDNFLQVTKEMRDRCIEIMESVLKELSPFAKEYGIRDTSEMNSF